MMSSLSQLPTITTTVLKVIALHFSFSLVAVSQLPQCLASKSTLKSLFTENFTLCYSVPTKDVPRAGARKGEGEEGWQKVCSHDCCCLSCSCSSFPIQFCNKVQESLYRSVKFIHWEFLYSFATLQSRWDAVKVQANSPDADPSLPIALSTDDGLAWLNHNNDDGNDNGNDVDNDATSADKQIMLASHTFDALSGLSEKLETMTNAQFINIHLGYHPVLDIETPEVVVQEEILDFGDNSKSCVMSLTGNLFSESFQESFLQAVHGEFLFAKYPHGNRYVCVSSHEPGQLFVIANSVVIILHPFSQIEEALCDCVKNLMQPSNDLLQDFCFHWYQSCWHRKGVAKRNLSRD
jgi:hypothetical protein